ncbi:MAG TPA: hypothetical protein VG498_21130 [Terriglobales bacterium]|nr:hypothetical protein [Terriglobales bacterium]
MNSTPLTVFIAVTSVAFVLQVSILLSMYLSMRRTFARLQQIASDLHLRLHPVIENTRDILADATPKVKEISSNLVEVSETLKTQTTTFVDAAVEMALRAKNKVVQADDALTRTLERVEKTTGAVQSTVLSPVRQVNGILQGISVGIGAFLNQKREVKNERQERRTQSDEGMFI